MKPPVPNLASRWWQPAALLLLGLAPLGAARAQSITTTYSYTGGPQAYTVPAGVSSLQVVATGAAGGPFTNATPNTAAALGAQVQATLAVVAGEPLTVVVGGQGAAGATTNAGGYNGGGSGSGGAGGGGGATELRRATATGDYLTSRNALLVAAGSGGTDQGAMGGTGGTPTGGNGIKTNTGTAGLGATQTAVGGGGAPGTTNTGGNGTGGAGGGGGYYGGGGGVPVNGAASGGGGASWVVPTGSSAISYAVAAAAPGALAITTPTGASFSPGSAAAGTTVTYTGSNLTGTTGLTVNGAAVTSFTVLSNTQLTFVVPAGAAPTGSVVITAPGRSASATGFTVALALVSLSPAANARTAPVANSAVGLTFSEPITAASATAANLRVFSSVLGGAKAGTVAPSGNSLGFAATAANRTNFRGGEQVQVTATAGLLTAGGLAVAPYAYQFFAAAGGTGRGNLLPGAADVAAPGNANGVGVADVNNDGNLDLLVPSASNNTVAVQLGNGAGGFAAGTVLTGLSSPFNVATADVNNDGNLDLLVPNRGTNEVWVYTGNGSGGFAAGARLAAGGDTRNCFAADLNNDGNLDVVAASVGNSSLYYYLGTGTGTFGAGTRLFGNNVSASVNAAAADFDGDGLLDLVTDSYSSSQVVVYRNLGGGAFAAGVAFTTGANPNDVAAADLNNDGRPDLVTPNASPGVSVLLNTSTGGVLSFATAVNVAAGAGAGFISLADVDADGNLDVLAAASNGTVAVLTNNGAGALTLAGNYASGAALDISAADFDNDGDVDVAVPTTAGTVAIRLNQPFTPVVTAISPNPLGVGLTATLTGLNLAGATLVVNGAPATVLTNTGTSLTFKVPAGATATGTTTVTTPIGTTSTTAFAVLLPPGNALAFDGNGDYVAVASPLSTDFTIEYWVRTTQTGDGAGGTQWWQGTGLVDAEEGGSTFDFGTSLMGSKVAFGIGAPDVTIQSTTAVNDGRWHHVAATRSGSTFTLYIDGKPEATSNGAGTQARNVNRRLVLGALQTGANAFFVGRLDEVRLWTTARSAAEILASYKSVLPVPQPNLAAYYSFDQGVPAGNNAGLTTLLDLTANANNGTLYGTALTAGSTTSNWVESYALVVPTASAATNVAAGGFTANWGAPGVGLVDGYKVDVSTSAAFATFTTFTVAAPATSLAITGQAAGTTVYYRVSADKASVAGQGGFSSVISVALPINVLTTCTTNNALNFDGTSDYVHVAAQLPGTGTLTVEGWIKPETFPSGTTNYAAILSGDGSAGGTFQVQLTSTGKVRFSLANDGLGSATSTGSVPLNAWSHVAVVYAYTLNLSTGLTLGGATFYINGALQGSTVLSLGGNLAAQPYSIGGWLNGGTASRFFDGSLNELRVWNTARTGTDISNNYQKGLAAQANLVALHSFDQGVASGNNPGVTTLNDDSNTSYTGQLNTFALTTGGQSNWVAGNDVGYTISLASFTPASGTIGLTTVTLTGTGLGGVTGVSFNGTPATAFTVVNGTTVTAVVPANATSGGISVTGACGPVTTPQAFVVNPPTVGGLSSVSELPGESITITGTGFLSSSTVSFGSVPAASVTYNSSSSLTAMVPVGAGANVVVVTTNGVSTAVAFSLLTVADAITLNTCTATASATSAADASWHYVLTTGGQVVLAYNTQGADLGTVSAELLRADPGQPVRQDGSGRYYLGRNWHLLSSKGPFAGTTVKVRFYGLTSEFDQLKAADPTRVTSLSALRLTQYSGANEDCQLTNNVLAADRRVLAPAASSGPSGSNFFVAEATVADHFSEFYLSTGAAPLPVELSAFTATLAPAGTAVNLAWATASEKNSARFDVERSLDGAAFASVGTVAAAGSSSAARAYAFADRALPAGAPALYYRLRQVDADGSAAYSAVRTVALPVRGLALQAYPNPAHPAGTVAVAGAPARATVEVLDALGRRIATATADASGAAQLVLPGTLPAGVYFVRSGAAVQRLAVE